MIAAANKVRNGSARSAAGSSRGYVLPKRGQRVEYCHAEQYAQGIVRNVAPWGVQVQDEESGVLVCVALHNVMIMCAPRS